MAILRALRLECWSCTSILSILLMCKALAPGVSAKAVLLDKIVAVVNAEVLTLQDFEDHLAMLKVFRPRPVELDREQAFQRFIDQTLMRQEALRTKIVMVEESEVTHQLRALEQRPGGGEALAHVMQEREISLSHVRIWLRNQVIVRGFIDRRIRLFVRVSESDVTHYYQAHQPAIGEPLNDAIREQILRILVEQRVNARVAQLVEELKRKANLQFPP